MKRVIASPEELRLRKMKVHLFGPSDWARVHGASMEEILEFAGPFPWPEEILRSPCPLGCKGEIRRCHLAHVGLSSLNGKPLGLMGLRALYPPTDAAGNRNRARFYHDGDREAPFEGKSFAQYTFKNRWYMTHLRIPEASRSLTFEEQQAFLAEKRGWHEVSATIEETHKEIIMVSRTGRWPNARAWASTRSASAAAPGAQITVGVGDSGGVLIMAWQGRDPLSVVGVGASLKLPA